MRINNNYLSLLRKYTKRDGVIAIIVYLIYLTMAFVQGAVLCTKLDARWLVLIGTILTIVDIAYVWVIIKITGFDIKSIGIHGENLKSSILYGVVGAIILRLFIVITDFPIHFNKVTLRSMSFFLLVRWIIAAISEEFVFRGFIQTRLAGIIKNRLFVSILTALLFLLIHYPVKWVATGDVSLTTLPINYVCYLVLLHFFCDFTYKRTNCLWGSIVLHFLYNIIGATIVFG